MHIYTGQVACTGVVTGNSLSIGPSLTTLPDSAEQTYETFSNAINLTKVQLQRLIDSKKDIEGEILEFQISLIEDDEFLAQVLNNNNENESYSSLWNNALNEMIAEYEEEENSYFRARSEDLKDLKLRVLRNLNGDGISEIINTNDTGKKHNDLIVISEELTPSQFIETNWENCIGIVLIRNSPNSHVAILAKSKGIPMLTGTNLDISQINSNVPVILDCINGDFIIEPDKETEKYYDKVISDLKERKFYEKDFLNEQAISKDGIKVEVQINVDNLLENPDLPSDYCDGVGLTRTEFLFSRGYLPDEDEQFGFYSNLINWAKGKPVTFRTFDAGGDKPIPGLTSEKDINPYLGLRGVRLSLAEESVFRTQLRAILRASCLGKVKIMIPMVTENSEIQSVRKLIKEEISDLHNNGVSTSMPELGMMVEVPVAALQIEDFDVDFYSIGTNDLIQYLASVSRNNPSVSSLYKADYPALWKLIASISAHGKAKGREVSVCGNIASDSKYTQKLLAAGIRSFSVNASSVAALKAEIRSKKLNLN